MIVPALSLLCLVIGALLIRHCRSNDDDDEDDWNGRRDGWR